MIDCNYCNTEMVDVNKGNIIAKCPKCGATRISIKCCKTINPGPVRIGRKLR